MTDLFYEEAGLKVSNTDDVEEVTNYVRAFRWVQGQLRDPHGLPISVRLLCEAHCLLLGGVRGTGSPVNCAARRTGSAAHGRATPPSCRPRPSRWPTC